ncbi:immunity 22 family protein [Listeria valentina]|uniref:immunity 22 family protein n=1 Tax=Listeria valentina TaxID=2705293 RepID=UPI0014307D27|nr:immunity 22 family protein [Listeria valentina]
MENNVSLWLGNFSSEDDLEEYMDVKYTKDGDSVPSQFEKDFKLGYYDRDLIEKDWIEVAENNIHDLLIDFSYDNQLIPQFKVIQKKYNTIILIYNYDYKQEKSFLNTTVKDAYEVDFIGVAKYRDE